MKDKYLIIGTLVGGIVLFLWGGVTHALLPQPINAFQDEKAVTDVIHANAPVNGIYFTTNGIFAAVAFRPDMADKMQHLGANYLTQILSDILSALLLAIFFLRVPGSVMAKAGWAALAGFAAFTMKVIPYWNWYGFPPAFVGMEALDLIGKFFIAGLLLAAFEKKFLPMAA